MRSLLILALSLCCCAQVRADESARLTWHQKITASPGHHAFTDLARFKDHFYLCYREGAGHVSMDGVIRILRSSDMKTWESAGTVKTIGDDRDPHFVSTADRLFVYFGVWDTTHHDDTTPPSRNKVRSHFSSSTDGSNWEAVQGVYESGWWLWRVRAMDNAFYSVAYTALRPVPDYRESRLLRSENGVDWKLVSTITRENMCGEADLWRRDEESLAIISRTGGGEHGRFFSSDASQKQWDELELNTMVHSPVVVSWHDRIFVAGRGDSGGEHVTKFWEFKGGALQELLVLPSGGDNAYPGLLVVEESLREVHPRFYVSWYSQADAATGENEPDGGAGVYVGEIALTSAEEEHEN